MITISEFKINNENTLIGYAYIEDMYSNNTLLNGSFTIIDAVLEYGETSSLNLIEGGSIPSTMSDYVTLDDDCRTIEIAMPLDTIETTLGYNSIYRITIKVGGNSNEELLVPCSYSRIEYAIAYNKCIVGNTLLDLLKGGVCDSKDMNKIVNALALEHIVNVLNFDMARKMWKSFYSDSNNTNITYNCGCNA